MPYLALVKAIRNSNMSASDSVENTLTLLAPYLSSRAREAILALCVKRSLSKGDTFIEPGRRNGKEYLLGSGIIRSYLLDREGNEVTLSFFEGPAVLSPFLTRTAEGRSILSYQTLTLCLIAEIDALAFESLIEKDLEVRQFANDILRRELMQKVHKEIGLAVLTAGERLEQFRKQYPTLENTVPHPMIASYLGITNVSLSRLRKRRLP
jgi:CRP-like cAMP-binding protein